MIQFILAGNGTQAVPRICCVGGDGLRTILFLRRCVQHVFNENAVAGERWERHRRRSHRSPFWMMGLPDTLMSSKGQKNFMFFCGFYAFLQAKGRFLQTLTAVLNLT